MTTVGRAKRRRDDAAGDDVIVTKHLRRPRGYHREIAEKGYSDKPWVEVDGYARAAPKRGKVG